MYLPRPLVHLRGTLDAPQGAVIYAVIYIAKRRAAVRHSPRSTFQMQRRLRTVLEHAIDLISLRVASLNRANELPAVSVGFRLLRKFSGNGQIKGHCHTGQNGGGANMRMGGQGSDREAKQVQRRDNARPDLVATAASRHKPPRGLPWVAGQWRCRTIVTVA